MALTKRAQRLFGELLGEPILVFIAAPKGKQYREILEEVGTRRLGIEEDRFKRLSARAETTSTSPIFEYLTERGVIGERSRLIGAVDAIVHYELAKELSDMGYIVGIPAPKTTKTVYKEFHR